MKYVIDLVLMTTIGALIGWITNYIAIKMLFRPHNEINVLGIKLQGVIPKRKKALAESIAKMIDEELISIKDITSTINSMEIDLEIHKIVEKIVEGKLRGELLTKFPMAAMFLSEGLINKVKEYLVEVISENKAELIDIIARKLEEKVDFKDVIRSKIEGFSLIKLERIVMTIAKNELKHIEYLGGVLGAIIGVLQFLITDILL